MGARLRYEIALALVVKIALVVAIKLVFFNDAPGKGEVAARIAERIAGTHSVAPAAQVPRLVKDRKQP